MPTQHEIDIRNAQREGWEAHLKYSVAETSKKIERTSHCKHEYYPCNVCSVELDKVYPILKPDPTPEKVTLSDGSVWSYEPHKNSMYPWSSPFNDGWTTPDLGVKSYNQTIGAPCTASDYCTMAIAMDRYNLRNK